MTRQQVLDTVNRHRAARGLKPIPMKRYDLAVRIARHHRLISEEYLEWARLGYFPTPAERAGAAVAGARPPFPRPAATVRAAAMADLEARDPEVVDAPCIPCAVDHHDQCVPEEAGVGNSIVRCSCCGTAPAQLTERAAAAIAELVLLDVELRGDIVDGRPRSSGGSGRA